MAKLRLNEKLVGQIARYATKEMNKRPEERNYSAVTKRVKIVLQKHEEVPISGNQTKVYKDFIELLCVAEGQLDLPMEDIKPLENRLLSYACG